MAQAAGARTPPQSPTAYRPQAKQVNSQSGAIQAKIDLSLTAHGLNVVRGADLKRVVTDFNYGNTYRHMSSKKLRLDAATTVIGEVISGDQETKEILEKAIKKLETLESRAESWERYTEDRKDQFYGDGGRNSLLNNAGNLYDSIVFEAIAAKGAAGHEHYVQDAGALAREYTYQRIASGQRAALLQEMQTNKAGVIQNVINHMTGQIERTGGALKLQTNAITQVKLNLAQTINTNSDAVIGVMQNLLVAADDLLVKGKWYGDSNLSGESYTPHLPKVDQFTGF